MGAEKRESHMCRFGTTERKNDSFSISDFQWNEETQEYHCPTGPASAARIRVLWPWAQESRNIVPSSQANPENGLITIAGHDRCKRRIHLGCSTECKKIGETDRSRATDHGIGKPGISKKPQINLLTKLHRSTQNRKATQRGEQVLK